VIFGFRGAPGGLGQQQRLDRPALVHSAVRLELTFSVRDTGIGMAPDQIERIFQPFSQADASTTRRFGGTGLGLTISANLVRLMGGRMWVESREGKGSTFNFTVPVQACGETANSLWRRTAVPAGENGVVLIADDNRTCRKTLVGLLGRWGFETVEAADGNEAMALVEAARPGAFRAVLLDAEMPGASGWEVAERIAGGPAARRAIVLAPILRMRKEAPGVAAAVTKPVCGLDLWQALGMGTVCEDAELSGGACAPASSAGVPPQRNAQGLRILLAEDNPVNQLFARRLLEKKGHSVTLAMDGEAALRALAAETFDVVLMDLQMPVMDGLEAARRIRERERGSRVHVPIIAMTAHAMSGDREVCLEAGMDGYVSKPIDPRELFATIQAAAEMRGSSGAPCRIH